MVFNTLLKTPHHSLYHMASHHKSFCLFLLLLLLLPSISIANQPYKNLTVGSSLTALNNKNNSYWSSLSGDFAFGFQQFGSQGFLLAIWFNKIPEKTIVWSANRNDLVPTGSTLQLSNTQLLLKDPSGKQIWTTPNLADNNNNVGSVSYAAMLDTGNFILSSTDSQVLWQTFDQPTDTILPSQIIFNGNLISSYSQTNYSQGRFRFAMQPDGNLVLSYPMIISTSNYWESKTANSGFQLIFNLSGSIHISAGNGNVVKNLTHDNPSTNDFYHRAVFEYDGVFRQYVYPKTEITGSSTPSPWPKAWSQVSVSIPPNMCLPITNGLGSGACGYNSYCSIGDDQRPTCHCPQGYEKIDPNDAFQGCKPTFNPQSCDVEENDAFEYFVIENSDWPDGDYEAFNEVDEDWCRKACLNDCYCSAVVSRGKDCWKKKFPLSFGRVDLEFTGKALIKFRKQNSFSVLVNQDYKKVKDKTLILVGSTVLLGTCGFLIATILIAYRLNVKRKKLFNEEKLSLLQGMNLRIFSYEELNKATSGFTEQLGSGTFATVYKGIIDDCMNKEYKNLVAVKKLENMGKEGDQEFKAEMSAIARTNHKNLVQLLGFCNEEPHRMLVYEFMHNGPLADYLFGCSKPNWYERVEVILGIARGLRYLHDECETQIIHCDIKPQNILLDDSFVARISDFGLAKLLKENQTRTMTAIRGTKGYVAPEWFRSLAITTKVDVYSFGIMLLEIISCRKSLEAEGEDELLVLADWAYDCFQERKVKMLVENDEEAKHDMKRVEKFIKIAIWCIQEVPSFRPSMKKVVQMLEGAIEVSTPPDPSPFITMN